MTGIVLLTGASGFVGRQVLRALGDQCALVRIVVRDEKQREFDDLACVESLVLSPDIFAEDADWWFKVCRGVDIVIHVAWYAEPCRYLQSAKNFDCLVGTLQMAKGAVQAGVRRFIGVGTCFEYELSLGILSAESPLQPLTPYAGSKAAVFMALSQCLPQQGVEFAWCRLFYLYGEGEDPRRLVPYLRSKFAAGQPAKLTSGKQIRDFLDVREAGHMIAEIALGHQQGPINICSGIPITVRQLAERIANEYGRRDLLEFGARPDNLIDPPCVVGVKIAGLFRENNMKNLDADTVKSFGDEWTRFDQSKLPQEEAQRIFDEYFAVFPWDKVSKDSTGFDMGCGSGRWARLMAPRVGHLHCIDPSPALEVAKLALSSNSNVSFHRVSVGESPLKPNSQDFGYSLGVLHHVPDTAGAIRACVVMLKPGAPFQLYLYYAFDNRPFFFRVIWRCTDLLRRVICRLPPEIKHLVTDILAVVVYYPLARLTLIAEQMGLAVASIPLSYYRNHSFYTMRTDARDRFGTPLEKRFTKRQIEEMMESAGLVNIRFSDAAPFWCAMGVKPGKQRDQVS